MHGILFIILVNSVRTGSELLSFPGHLKYESLTVILMYRPIVAILVSFHYQQWAILKNKISCVMHKLAY